jgi:hypothetical protein
MLLLAIIINTSLDSELIGLWLAQFEYGAHVTGHATLACVPKSAALSQAYITLAGLHTCSTGAPHIFVVIPAHEELMYAHVGESTAREHPAVDIDTEDI